ELIKEYEQYGKDAEYLANVANMDMAIGRLLQYLDEKGLSKNTFVLFASDNGPYRQPSTGIFRGKKSFLFEGGIRVPGIIKWPHKIKEGVISTTPASFVDMLPTIAQITGSTMPEDRTIDGTNILPVLFEEPFKRDRPLYWYFYKRYPISALRKGDYVIMGNPKEQYKLTSHPFDSGDQVYFKNAKLEEFQVYNLKDDPAQKIDLYPDNSEKFSNLKMEIIKYQKEIIDEGPTWEGLPEN
ncbi:MAG: sulfatase-like hydrolase/transferase, partial [Cyclobacteriaceae bacterium]|nr:sulfatase-like hydrolase/transferase [Cyclobacteriaceae bacterium]